MFVIFIYFVQLVLFRNVELYCGFLLMFYRHCWKLNAGKIGKLHLCYVCVFCFLCFFSITDFLNRELKKTVIKTVMWNVTLYGLETWTLREMDVKLLEAFEIWTWRQMEDTSWKEK